jgi:hypothetical protein
MKTIVTKSLWAALAAAVALGVSPAHAKNTTKIGMPQAAGPFQVTLTTIPVVPQNGANRFRVEVNRKGETVSDAEVTLTLTMPLHRHGGRSDVEPKITKRLLWTQPAYMGNVRLPMGGVWQAQVAVKSGAEKGTAHFKFLVGKGAPIHLGMAHMAGDFVVVLTTDPATPQAGENRILVKVERNGQPVNGASVIASFQHVMMPMPKGKVDSTLKAMERESKAKDPSSPHGGMGEHNVVATLKPANAATPDAPLRAGQYEGMVTLPVPGDWEARVAIEAGDTKGTALYQFRTAQ